MSAVARQQSAFCPPGGKPLDRGVSFVGIGSGPACSPQVLRFVEGVDGVFESRKRARVLTALPIRPSSTLVNRGLSQARPVVMREQLCGPVQVLECLVNEPLSGAPLCPRCVQRHLAGKLQLQPGQFPISPADRQQPRAMATRLCEVAGYQLDPYPPRCRPQKLMQQIINGGQPGRVAGWPLQRVGAPPEGRDRVRHTPKTGHFYSEPDLGAGIPAADGRECTYAP